MCDLICLLFCLSMQCMWCIARENQPEPQARPASRIRRPRSQKNTYLNDYAFIRNFQSNHSKSLYTFFGYCYNVFKKLRKTDFFHLEDAGTVLGRKQAQPVNCVLACRLRNCRKITYPSRLSFSPIAQCKNRLHSPLCARFLHCTLEEKSCAIWACYFAAVPKERSQNNAVISRPFLTPDWESYSNK